MSSGAAALSIAAVALAAVTFTLTGPEEPSATPDTGALVAAPTPTAVEPEPVVEPEPRKPAKPEVRRGAVYVEVYNNSGISGLAGRTAAKVRGAGWQVVGEDNWYGTIPESTVYFPPRLADAGRLLARDLGVGRTRPAIAPMRFDRLTVILTGPLG